jgi:lipid-A-disaccharide synthase-like uncharacterized protein
MTPDSVPPRWLVLGFFGQALFTGRFLVQWIASERRGRSVLPTLFWWLSIAGGLCLATYAALRRDPVIFLGQAAGLGVYLRNLVLARRVRGAAPGV